MTSQQSSPLDARPGSGKHCNQENAFTTANQCGTDEEQQMHLHRACRNGQQFNRKRYDTCDYQ